MENQIIILGIRPFDFTDSKTNKRIKGATMYYITKDVNENHYIGHEVCKTSISVDQSSTLTDLPGLYNAHYVPVIKNGQPALKLDSLSLVAGVDINAYFES